MLQNERLRMVLCMDVFFLFFWELSTAMLDPHSRLGWVRRHNLYI